MQSATALIFKRAMGFQLDSTISFYVEWPRGRRAYFCAKENKATKNESWATEHQCQRASRPILPRHAS